MGKRSLRGDGLMPLLWALCALLAVAPSQVARALPSWSPAHLAAFALLSGEEAAPAQVLPATTQRAAMLLALCRHTVASQAEAAPADAELPSQATAHLAGRTAPLFAPQLRPHDLVPPSSHALTAPEIARLSGVRTNIRLI